MSEIHTLPLITACPELAKHGLRIPYRRLWELMASGEIPSVRVGSRVHLVGEPSDIAKLVSHVLKARTFPPRAKYRKAA